MAISHGTWIGTRSQIDYIHISQTGESSLQVVVLRIVPVGRTRPRILDISRILMIAEALDEPGIAQRFFSDLVYSQSSGPSCLLITAIDEDLADPV